MRRWIIPVVGVLLGLGGAGFYLAKTKQPPPPEFLAAGGPTPTSIPENLSNWDDPAGFSFQYPQNLTVDKHDEDQENYAHIELTSSNHPGRVIVWVKDLPPGVADASSWVGKEKGFGQAAIVDTTLGGQAAKKVLVTGPPPQVFIGTVYDDVLFYLEAFLEEEKYWNGVVDTLWSTFRFEPLVEVEQEYVDEEIVVE